MENTNELCQLVGADVSFASNLHYTQLDAANCSDLSSGSEFYFIETDVVVTDSSGLVIELQLAWLDLMEAIVWLAILFSIELLVRLHDKGISQGSTVRMVRAAKLLLYCGLWCAAGYWVYRGHWMFAWDEALWILGFAAIEMNMSDWRKEMQEVDVG